MISSILVGLLLALALYFKWISIAAPTKDQEPLKPKSKKGKKKPKSKPTAGSAAVSQPKVEEDIQMQEVEIVANLQDESDGNDGNVSTPTDELSTMLSTATDTAVPSEAEMEEWTIVPKTSYKKSNSTSSSYSIVSNSATLTRQQQKNQKKAQKKKEEKEALAELQNTRLAKYRREQEAAKLEEIRRAEERRKKLH